MSEILVFDIEGPFAHFRKGYTTTSPITYDFPPRTVLIGMLGAIIGYDENTYIEKFSLQKCKIGIRILKPGYKIKLKENWREGPGGKAEMKNVSQVGLEVLRFPSYRIYFHHIDKDGIFKDIETSLINGESIYTPYLGLKEFACIIRYIGTYQFKISKDDKVKVISVIPEDPKNPYSSEDLDDKEMQDYILRRDIVPNETLKGREFKRIAVLYESNGKSLWLKPKKDVIYIPQLDERIMFLE